jgi:hypothetical protein
MKTQAVKQRFIFLIFALQMMSLPAMASPESLQSMAWPLQLGESVRDLSRLIYPKSQRMQQYFIAETIRLNREQQPDLHPNTAFAQQQQIIIPSIKQLSGKSRAGAGR